MLILTIPAMTCGHCSKVITQTVIQLDPAAELKFDLSQHRVEIQTQTATNRLLHALADQGYQPEEIITQTP